MKPVTLYRYLDTTRNAHSAVKVDLPFPANEPCERASGLNTPAKVVASGRIPIGSQARHPRYAHAPHQAS